MDNPEDATSWIIMHIAGTGQDTAGAGKIHRMLRAPARVQLPPSDPRNVSSNKTIGGATALVIACSIALASIWCAWQAATAQVGLDYYAFWVVVDFQSSHTVESAAIYGLANQRRIGLAAERTVAAGGIGHRHTAAATENLQLYEGRIETLATPFFNATMRCLMSGDYERDFRAFVAVSLFAHVAGVGMLCRTMGYSPALTAWCIVAFGLPFLPFRSNFTVLNVGCLQLLQVASVRALVSRGMHRPCMIAAGFVLGASIAFKPTVAPVLVAISAVMAIDGARKPLLDLLGGAVAAAGAAWLTGCLCLHRWGCWSDWVFAIKEQMSLARLMNPWNCSLTTQLSALTEVNSSAGVTAGLLGGLTACAYRSRAASSPGNQVPESLTARWVLAGAVGCVIALVGSPLVWAHYLLLTIPLLLWLGRRALLGQATAGAVSFLAVAFLLLTVVAQAMGLGRQINEMILGNLATTHLVALAFHAFATPPRGVSS